MSALTRIKQAGFELALIGDVLEIKPASALTQKQREFLKSHKAEIILELRNEESPPTLQVFNYRVTDKPEAELTICTTDSLTEVEEGLINRYGKRLISVTCYTPNGDPLQIEARDEEHAAWLKRMSPKPQGTHSC